MVFSLVALCVVVPWLIMVVYTAASRGLRAGMISTVMAIPVVIAGVLFSMDILKNLLHLSGNITILLVSVYTLDLIMWSIGLSVLGTLEKLGKSVKSVIAIAMVLFLGAIANFFIYDSISIGEEAAANTVIAKINDGIEKNSVFSRSGQGMKYDIAMDDRENFPQLEGIFTSYMKQQQKDSSKKIVVYQVFEGEYDIEAFLRYPEKEGDMFIAKALYRSTYSGTAWVRFNELFFALVLLGSLGYVYIAGKSLGEK